jgi:hypothetical protein
LSSQILQLQDLREREREREREKSASQRGKFSLMRGALCPVLFYQSYEGREKGSQREGHQVKIY